MAAEVPGPVDALGVGGVDSGQRRPQAVSGKGKKDEVDMIVHQAPAEAGRAVALQGGGKQLQIGPAVAVVEE
jgi:hypothetical protein